MGIGRNVGEREGEDIVVTSLDTLVSSQGRGVLLQCRVGSRMLAKATLLTSTEELAEALSCAQGISRSASICVSICVRRMGQFEVIALR